MGITFDEMNSDDVVSKLRLICDDPLEIWEAFGKYFGKGFFNYPIERDFGITPDSHQRMINRFDKTILEYKDLSDKQIDDVCDRFKLNHSNQKNEIAKLA